MQHDKLVSLVKAGIMAGLYVVLTVLVAPLSYGAIQIRIGEMFNHLVDFNKRYIWALTVGCLIANFASPLGVVDMLVGTFGTLSSALIVYFITKRMHNIFAKLTVSTIVPTVVGMLPIALELHYIQNLPFWITYGTTMLGELVSLLIGAVLVYALSKRIDLSK